MARHFLRCRARMGGGFSRSDPEAEMVAAASPQISTTVWFGRIPIILSLFTIPAQKFVIALIDSLRSHP
ncbi:hypothetical protein GGE16_000636 [Rhizobium leguminosarum]|uniref:Uncharacterized protein n=1 Tax=Rhizobium leguminosarum TaxID=384 RepID=A0AAE2MG13_RHILE|nr:MULTISPECIES: hypothetical protein [Rhizobium]MBB4288620.1 hypothetical protein [Rhizobium leguminosarum]MBB4295287.1 hypothetical protein [Rhizobium leguminosarum]MBB4306680.1 hypothetical protein [Rhizobium leguminosarum]MBB4417738.1 hypothetical protein [Rhizobium leguminosarum]MBB4432584.1 hypothetical protein [Rhizobium esperanzae]